MAKHNPERAPVDDRPHSKTYSILFSDLQGFSGLIEAQTSLFFSRVLPEVSAIATQYPAVCINTWGDAIFGVYESALAAAQFAFALRNHFRDSSWKKRLGFPEEFGIRIALHHAGVYLYDNPITGRKDAYGPNVNLAARIEPVVAANEVWATHVFRDVLKTYGTPYGHHVLGKVELVKGWGKADLCRLWQGDEPAPRFSRRRANG